MKSTTGILSHAETSIEISFGGRLPISFQFHGTIQARRHRRLLQAVGDAGRERRNDLRAAAEAGRHRSQPRRLDRSCIRGRKCRSPIYIEYPCNHHGHSHQLSKEHLNIRRQFESIKTTNLVIHSACPDISYETAQVSSQIHLTIRPYTLIHGISHLRRGLDVRVRRGVPRPRLFGPPKK